MQYKAQAGYPFNPRASSVSVIRYSESVSAEILALFSLEPNAQMAWLKRTEA